MSHPQIESVPAWVGQVFNTMDALLVVLDLEGRVVLFNRLCEEISGRSSESIKGKPIWQDLIPRDELSGVFEAFQKMVRAGVDTSHENDWLASDGSRRRIAWRNTCIRDASGTVTHVVATGVEISALKESEERYRWLSAQTIEGITHHEKGIIVDVNARCCEMFGYTYDEMIGRPVVDFATKESGEIIIQRIRAHLVGPYVVDGLHKDGTVFPLEIVTREATQGTRHVRIAGLRDVSERKRLESERERATEQLHRAQRMQTVGLLAGGIAHDFNNLLSIMLGAAELALHHGESNPVVTRYLDRILGAAEVAATLTHQLLVFGGKDTPKPEVIDIREVLVRLGDLIKGVVGETITVEMELAEQPLRICVARPHIEQIIMNLTVNAADAMRTGGRFQVQARALDVEESFTTSLGQTLLPRRYVVLEIGDDGHGMTPDVAGRALEPFFTTKSGGHGTGLGLSVVYTIVTSLAGGLELETGPEVGTRWRIFLPATDEAPPARGPVHPIGTSGGGTILVVEDEDDLRELLVSALEHTGFEVISANSADAAIPLFEAAGGSIVLLLTDVVMPGLSGAELAEYVRRTQPELPVLFISGYPASVLEHHHVDGIPLIQKPFRIADLMVRIREAMTGPRP